MDKEIQELGEKVLEIPSLLADETKNDTGFTFYNDSVQSITDEEEKGINNDHFEDWMDRLDTYAQTENNEFHFYELYLSS